MRKIPKLKVPVWLDIIYYLLLIVGPVVITSLELFSTHSTLFKWSLSSVGSLLILVSIIKKFVLHRHVEKLREKCTLLEHDYSIEVGNPKNIKAQWKRYNMLLHLYSAITVLLVSALVYIFITALANQVLAFRGAATLIILFVLVALVFRTITFASILKSEEEENVEE